MTQPDLLEKFEGGLLGHALGDAIGEMAFDHPTRDLLTNALREYPLYVYTDDTAMALGLAQSLIEAGTVEPEQLGKTFQSEFFREPLRGYAPGPPTIFQEVAEKGRPFVEVAASLFNGTGSYGNGGAMRVTPAGLFFCDNPDDDLYSQVEQATRVTHTHALGVEGAVLVARLVALVVPLKPSALDPFDTLDVLGRIVREKTYQQAIKNIHKLLREDLPTNEAVKVLGTNVMAHHSVPFALYSFLSKPEDVVECLMQTILVPGDRDTVGAMVGGLLGSYHGYKSLPEQWLGKLENAAFIKEKASLLWSRKLQKS